MLEPIPAPHFILQAEPDLAAARIEAFIAGL